MKRFDKRLRKQLKREAPKIPAETKIVFNEAVDKIRAGRIRKRPWFSVCAVLGCAVVIFVFLNFKTGLLDEERNIVTESDVYTSFENAKHKNLMEEPQIEEIESIRVGMIDYRNPEIRQYTDMILAQFKKDRKEGQKNSDTDCEMLANTERWFTLRLTVKEKKGDTSSYYYNIDKTSCRIVELSDLFVHEFDYTDVFSEGIKAQMREEIKREPEKEYWIDSCIEGDFQKIDKNQEFYFNQKGNLVIVLEKGKAAPEEKGNLRFVIEKEVFEAALK